MERTMQPTPPAAATRSAADRRMRQLLRLPENGPRESIVGAHNAFSKSIAISAVRCTITYLLLPVLAPIVDLSGTAGPILGIVLSIVSITAIIFSTRRFFAADHRYRWAYAAFGGSILLLLFVSAVVDITALTS